MGRACGKLGKACGKAVGKVVNRHFTFGRICYDLVTGSFVALTIAQRQAKGCLRSRSTEDYIIWPNKRYKRIDAVSERALRRPYLRIFSTAEEMAGQLQNLITSTIMSAPPPTPSSVAPRSPRSACSIPRSRRGKTTVAHLAGVCAARHAGAPVLPPHPRGGADHQVAGGEHSRQYATVPTIQEGLPPTPAKDRAIGDRPRKAVWREPFPAGSGNVPEGAEGHDAHRAHPAARPPERVAHGARH